MLTRGARSLAATGTAVLTFHLLRDYRTLLRLVRWTVWIYLLLLALTSSEVLREGVVVYGRGDAKLVLDSSFWWLAWFATINLAALFPVLLVPAAAVPALLLRYTPLAVVADYGLARLGWLDAVHSPLLAALPWAAAALPANHTHAPGWSDPAWARFWT